MWYHIFLWYHGQYDIILLSPPRSGGVYSLRRVRFAGWVLIWDVRVANFNFCRLSTCGTRWIWFWNFCRDFWIFFDERVRLFTKDCLQQNQSELTQFWRKFCCGHGCLRDPRYRCHFKCVVGAWWIAQSPAVWGAGAEAYLAAGAPQLRGEQFGSSDGDALPALVRTTSFRINDFGLETRGAKLAECSQLCHVFCSSLAAKKSPVSRMNRPCFLTYV